MSLEDDIVELQELVAGTPHESTFNKIVELIDRLEAENIEISAQNLTFRKCIKMLG